MKRLLLLLLLIAAPAGAQEARPKRIVSLIPAVTEMIYAMGDGARVVAVSNYDNFPAAVARLPRVGGLLDPSVERILALTPDLVIVYASQKELIAALDRVRIPYFNYEHRGLADVMTTIRSVGTRIGSSPRADTLAAGMDRVLADIHAKTSGLPHPATLLVFSRERGSLRNVYASGGYGFLHDMLEVAGGRNVFAGMKQQSVQAGTELLLTSKPEVIIELIYGSGLKHADSMRDLHAWDALGSLPAVRTRRVLARAIHPDAFK